MKTFVKEWAAYYGVAKEELGEKTGISPKTIQRWYDEETTPSVAQLTEVSKVLDVPIDDLIHMDPEKFVRDVMKLKEINPDMTDSDAMILFNLKGDAERFVNENDIDFSKNKLDPGSNMLLNFRLEDWMDYANVTNEEIQEKTGIPKEVIEEWKNNSANPTIYQAIVLSSFLNVPLETLLLDSPSSYEEKDLSLLNDYDHESHLFETGSFRTAIRFKNYLNSINIDNEMFVVRVSSVKSAYFMVLYESPLPFDVLDIMKIALNPKYKDPRERESSLKKKFKDLVVIKD